MQEKKGILTIIRCMSAILQLESNLRNLILKLQNNMLNYFLNLWISKDTVEPSEILSIIKKILQDGLWK
ncbi:MAG TPA: hypothetical protein VEW92_06135 [Nitrososphaeraceae archaeon]|jgi:hypothetical protein|nr:hypothetical protein [Nitrososphaeraceae archaeon]